MKNKKLLMFLLAVNTLTASHLMAANGQSKYDKLYDGMIKNIESGKSNRSNYDLLEEVLNKRNKELKDLYEQSDYIVKPEYLEWQIFFSGFYDHKSSGDNTLASGDYHSDPNYSNGDVKGKVFAALQEAKLVDLGIRIPLKDVNKPALDLNITPTKVIVYDGQIEVVQFELPEVNVNVATPGKIIAPTLKFTDTGNTDSSWIGKSATEFVYAGNSSTTSYKPGDTAPIAQIDLDGGTLDVNSTLGVYDLNLMVNSAAGVWGSGSPRESVPLDGNPIIYKGLNVVAVMKLVGGHTIKLNNLDINFSGSGKKDSPLMLFHIDAHNSYGSSIYDLSSTVNTKISGKDLLFFGIQYHTDNNNRDAGLVHSGTIESSGSNNIIFATINAGGTDKRDLYFDNKGTINLNGDEELLGVINLKGNTGNGGKFINDGNINLNGNNSFGIMVTNEATGLPKILLNNPLNIYGDGNIGLTVLQEFDMSQSVIKLNIDGSNAYGIVGDYTAGGNANLGTLPTTGYMTYKNYELSMGANSNKSTLVSLVKGSMEFDSSGKETSILGSENLGFVAGVDGKLIIDNNITSVGDKNLPLIANEGKIEYAGTVSTNGLESHGIVVTGAGTVDNISKRTVNSIVQGNSSVSLYNEGTVNINDGGSFKSLGEKGTIIFSKGNTTIKGENEYEIGKNGIGFYADGGIITLDSSGGTSNIKVGEGSVFSYVSGAGKINFIDGFNVTLDPNAIGFIYQGDGTGSLTQSALNTNLSAKYTGLNNLNINLSSGSRLFVFEEYGSVNMSDIPGLSSGIGNVSGSGKDAFLWKGKLVLDTPGTINLDDANEYFNRLEKSAVGVTLNSGVVLNGSQVNQVGLADIFSYAIPTAPGAIDYREMLNQGEINLSGGKSVGIYTDNGIIINDNLVNVSGNNGIGLFGENGTVIRNTINSQLTVGNQGIGIYGISYQKPGTPQSYGTGNVDIENSGIINAINGESVGIYAQVADTKTGNIINNGIINIGLDSQGMYLESKGTNAQFINNNTIYGDAGSTNSIGMYLNNETAVNLVNSGNIILDGDQTKGIFSIGTGAANISNTGTISVGNASSINDPSIGIYSANASDTITNTGNINSGLNSLGIYSKYAHVNHNGGTISIGENGTGIYGDSTVLNIASGAGFSMNGSDSVGIYGINSTTINNNTHINVGNNNYGIIAQSNSDVINNGSAVLGQNSVFIYSDGAREIINNNTGVVTTTGSDNIAFYMKNGGSIKNYALIDATSGISNIGIINIGGSIENYGEIKVGDSDVKREANGNILVDQSTFAVGIYGAGANIINNGNIAIGKDSVGIYAKDAPTNVINTGNILADQSGAIGLFVENSTIENSGNIVLNGENSIGIAAVGNGHIINTGNIYVNGQNSKGIYMRAGSSLFNTGEIVLNGENSHGVQLDDSSSIINYGTIKTNAISSLVESNAVENRYELPTLVNAGIIDVSENFIANGMNIVIQVDPNSMRSTASDATISDAKFISDAVQFNAPGFEVSEDNPVIVDPGYTVGTNALTYKLLNVFNPSTTGGGPNSGLVPVKSGSLTWEAIPELNSQGNVDIWMKKIPYDKFTSGLWYAQFGKALDSKYGDAQGEALTIFNKMDFIANENDFRRITAGLAGNVYSNINQRESDMADVFENSINLLQNSKNNTKENVKINIITGKGQRREDTDGVEKYDVEHVGIVALREVERTYKHTFGYSAGYLHSGFEFKDGNESEEWVNTLQLGIHSKYKSNGWVLKNDLTARASIHNIDRNIDWPEPYGRSEMDGTYETYSFTSNNRLGHEFNVGKNSSVTPYGAFKAMFVTRPTFEEKGLERLKVEGNSAWSVKPRAGVELKSEVSLSKKSDWKLKGTLDLAYEYELANLNEREKAKLVAIEDNYHNLAKPEEEKGQFKTQAAIGVEVENKYGVFITGEYVIGENDKEDYRAGVTLKAVF